MICPFCGANDDRVIDSRATEAGRVIRRRRQCLACSKRFTTYERTETTARLVVVKRDGSRVPFSPESILRGVVAACGKRPVPEEAKLRLVEAVEEELYHDFEREVESRTIAERVMRRLRDLDEVAYVRFASEHLRFRSAEEMAQAAAEVSGRPRDVKDQQSLFAAPPPEA